MAQKETTAKEATTTEGLTEGRIVHYVMERGHNVGAHRPAIVVRDWHQENGLVQLQVFTDGLNDGFVDHAGAPINVIWCPSVVHDEIEKAPGTWHWPERV